MATLVFHDDNGNELTLYRNNDNELYMEISAYDEPPRWITLMQDEIPSLIKQLRKIQKEIENG